MLAGDWGEEEEQEASPVLRLQDCEAAVAAAIVLLRPPLHRTAEAAHTACRRRRWTFGALIIVRGKNELVACCSRCSAIWPVRRTPYHTPCLDRLTTVQGQGGKTSKMKVLLVPFAIFYLIAHGAGAFSIGCSIHRAT